MSKILPYILVSTGAVLATVPRTFNCGTLIPNERQKSEVHAPAAQRTRFVFMRPYSVMTDETLPACVSIPRTVHPVNIFAPNLDAAFAIAGVAL